MITLRHQETVVHQGIITGQAELARKSPGGFYLLCKRLLDAFVSGLLLFFLAPLFLIIAILIRLDSPGPAIFSQKRFGVRTRHGLNGEPELEFCTFTFYKFRTMFNNVSSELHREFIAAYIQHNSDAMAALQAGEVPAASQYKMVGDPRVTRIGRVLRKTSLDELPQLWNVLIGDMSLVGPRPALPYEVEMYEPQHLRRLQAKPGLTGLWQVKGRSSTTFGEMVRLDVEYIDNQSLWMDIRILLATPMAVITGRGAN